MLGLPLNLPPSLPLGEGFYLVRWRYMEPGLLYFPLCLSASFSGPREGVHLGPLRRGKSTSDLYLDCLPAEPFKLGGPTMLPKCSLCQVQRPVIN